MEPAGLPGRAPCMQALGAIPKVLLVAAQDQAPINFTAQSKHIFPGARDRLPRRVVGRKALTVLLSLSPSQVNKCSHFFQLKNISFCGYHPKNNK